MTILSLLLAMTTAAAPEGPVTLAMPGLRCVNVDDKSCSFFGDYFAEQLATGRAIRVSTQTEIAALLGFERQKALLGCADTSSSCVAELAGGLGVEGLVVGNLAKFGDEYVLSLKILSARDGTPFGADTRRVVGDRKLLDALSLVAAKLAATLPQRQKAAGSVGAPAVAVAPPALEPESTGRPFLGGPAVWGTGSAGLVATGVGLAMFGAAHGVRDELFEPAVRSETELNALIGRGVLYQGLGVGLVATGAVLVAVAGTLFALDATSAPSVSLGTDGRGTTWVTVGGRIP